MSLFYRPENAWVGDLIPYYEEGTFYAYYLHDPRIIEGKYAEETTWHLATTKDFVQVDYQGEAIKRGTKESYNLNNYTGSIIKDAQGKYHAFYTAFNENKPFVNGKSVQLVMKAVGESLYELETDPNFLFPSDGKIYEEFDWRDPFVFWVEEEQCYFMLLASRRQGAGDLRGGCISLSKSKDLETWEYCEPFYDPKMYITMECPEVFKMGEYWYLVFSTFSDRFTTHYRYAKSLEGPWIIPADDVFDTRANYAIKTASDGERRIAFGWVATKEGKTDFGPWDWGGTMIFHELIQNPQTGELKAVMIDSVGEFFEEKSEISAPVFYNDHSNDKNKVASDTLGAMLFDSPSDTFSVTVDFDVLKAKEFGIALHVDEGMETGYFLRMLPEQQLIAWDLWPRAEKGEYQWQIKGDIPYQVETSRLLPKASRYRVRVLREGSMCVVYVNDEIALSTRLYNHSGKKVGVYVVQGEVVLHEIEIKE
ncbi:DUF4975 domain-containing protein (plasmid) [Enterococcus gilvus]|jgi:beta-fructofuranosidase|uniref:glycoside hydrolase family 32 protein n=1 Tax=Enterococcus gilvus TaxID=160453 RepID=UPI000DF5FC8D|nr:glycoside hydrolase family 32 protein [Enterococcus gilvus]AXG40579.1 DUF4975 domain-containing protein [Enterococcus gilvus]